MNSDPNFLNRWLDRRPVGPLTRTRYFLTISAFHRPVTWLGYSDIIATFNYTLSNNFSIVNWGNIANTGNPTFVLAIAYENANGTTIRYKLWDTVGETFFFDIKRYAGQVIKKNFRFEVWSVDGQANVVLGNNLTPILLSLLTNTDYRKGTDMLLVPAAPIQLAFKTPQLVIPTQPDQNNLVCWFDPLVGITISGGNSVSQWVDRTNTVTLVQAVGGNQPTRSLAGYIQFLGVANLLATGPTVAPISHFYLTLLNGTIGAANTNSIMDNQGGLLDTKVTSNPDGSGFIVTVGGFTQVVPYAYISDRIVIEIQTITGQVWAHFSGAAVSILMGTLTVDGSDVMTLLLGDPAGTLASGLDVFGLLGYSTTQTAPNRQVTLEWLLGQALPLPMTFPANSFLISNPDQNFATV